MTTSLPLGRMKKTDVIKGSSCNIPDKPGIYRHINKITNAIEYIGQSLNVRTRQQQHQRNGKLNTETHWIVYSTLASLTKSVLRAIEQNHIKKHNPSGNTCKGGNGR